MCVFKDSELNCDRINIRLISDLKQFVINTMNDIYDGLVKLEFIKPDENDKLETYKECLDFFKDLHTGDEDFPDIFKYTFNIGKIEIIKNIDSLEVHKLRKNTKKYNV